MSEDHAERIGAIHRELHSHLPPEPALRVKALESLLVEKGLLDPKTVDAWIEVYTEQIGPKRGAEVVARAWSDPAFKARLLENGTAAITEIGFEGWAGGHLNAVENTPTIHNLVVCTLCSCYPHSLLGIPPNWYKTAAYRSRAVRDPRGVIAEFGETIPDDVEVRVWDFDRRASLSCAPRAAGRHRGLGRAPPRRARHPQCDDRGRTRARTGDRRGVRLLPRNTVAVATTKA